MTQFQKGDRVLFNSDPSDLLNGSVIAGEIVQIVAHMALIAPDDCGVNGVPYTTTRELRNIRKETD